MALPGVSRKLTEGSRRLAERVVLESTDEDVVQLSARRVDEIAKLLRRDKIGAFHVGTPTRSCFELSKRNGHGWPPLAHRHE